jgi:hypothetical protein
MMLVRSAQTMLAAIRRAANVAVSLAINGAHA